MNSLQDAIFVATVIAVILPHNVYSANLTCAACQGTLGDPCDVAPWTVAAPIPCDGSCITWRSLYAAGRGLRTIWKGCDKTLFPAVLNEEWKGTCATGNFFVECSRTCDTNMCNMNHTGIPKCWTCHADHADCFDHPPSACEEPTPTTMITTPTSKLECISCQGGSGDFCDNRAYLASSTILCEDGCVTWKSLFAYNRSMISVWRGCKETLFPNILHMNALDSCDSSADITFIQCTSTCQDTQCNKYSTGFTPCWTNRAERIEDCTDTFTRPPFIPDLELVTNSPNSNTLDLNVTLIPANENITCTACQGVKGDMCDVSPESILTQVNCTGYCITRRQLYATGREFRSIWRGCDTTLFPNILDERFRDACQYGNFFVDCTASCRTGHYCNQNNTGIPPCWNCLGDSISCDVTPPASCGDPVIAPVTIQGAEIQCVTCSGGPGSNCDNKVYNLRETVDCMSSCVTLRRLDNQTRSLTMVWRGCDRDLSDISVSQPLETCDQAGEHITCMNSCYDSSCNKYTSGFPDCWDTDGNLLEVCQGISETAPPIIRSPSRVTTKKPYSIQDAYGGDDFRGNWRPPEGSNWTAPADTWTNWYRQGSRPYNSASSQQADLAIRLLGFVAVGLLVLQ